MTASGGETPAGSGRLEADQILGIYDQWHDDLQRFLLATCGNAELADELLQATFSRLVEVGQTARPESIRGWLFKVAHNELRLWRRRSATHARWLGSGPPGPTAAAVPWEEAIRGEEAAAVRRALSTLPFEQRQVVEARIQRGQTFAAIAAELGLPLGTVLTRMRLALAKLRRSLGEKVRDEQS